jgi:hypothetical protein
MNDCRLQDLSTPYQQVIHIRIPVNNIFFGIQKFNFPPPSHNPSKFHIPVNIIIPPHSPTRGYRSETQPLDALETPYFEPKKKGGSH